MTAALIDRLTAIQRFLRAADGQVPDEKLVAADTMMERAGDRLALSSQHTVVALAGTTGSGKSSLFNALARLYVSPVGARRPTTAEAYALVWGPLAEADPLLDWLGVLPRHRLARESALDGHDEAGLRGLILLDMPDVDSVDLAHRTEVDRLLGLVDMVVWVMDPQKYADTVLHDGYLRQFRRHQEATVVVLNQADRLSPEDVAHCLADLRRLLDKDGLGEVPTLATSARVPEGLVDLRELLSYTVAGRQAVLRRLSADITTVVAGLAGLGGPPVGEEAVDASARELTEALAAAAGVPAVVDATERAYLDRAARSLGWLPARALRRLRHRPHRDGRGDRGIEEGEGAPARSAAADALGAREAALVSPVGLAVRDFAERARQPLPEAWSAAVIRAARSRVTELPGALDRAVRTTGPDLLGSPLWWRVTSVVQWIAALAALAGPVWLAVAASGSPALGYPAVGPVSLPVVLLAAGLLSGLLLDLVLRPVVRLGAERAAARTGRQLRFAVAEAGREYVQAPVRDVLHHYAEAREALASAQDAS